MVDGCTVRTSGEVQISLILKTSTGKCPLRNLHLIIVPDEERMFCNDAICACETVLRYLFLFKAILKTVLSIGRYALIMNCNLQSF